MSTHAVTALAAVLTLAAWSACDMGVPGEPVDAPELLSAVDAIAADWRADTALPSIDTERCADDLGAVDVRTASEAEWINELRLCPMMSSGCSTRCGRGVTGCATGVVYWMAGAPRVFLSPGETADGHAHTVRHEVAHVLSECAGRGLDYAHTYTDVWGADGVVWRRSGS